MDYTSLMLLFSQLFASFFGTESPETRVQVKGKGEWGGEYDYIVVGAGSAGSVVAARLSELQDQQVLLLEAGGVENIITDIPLLASVLESSNVDWSYKTEPQKQACLGLNENRASWPRGKLLGGTSAIGHVVYTRRNRFDYDRWAEMGAKGWSWRDVLPYFLKLEDHRDPVNLQNGHHSRGGPLTVEHQDALSDMGQLFPELGRQLGFNSTDVNGDQQLSFTPTEKTTRNGSRCSAARAYLAPASKQNKNLHILVNSQATKILFNEKKRAIGIKFVKDKLEHVVFVRKEVIVSGGAINSPQLLMLSGVSPREHLEKMGIKVVQDLPGVGKNLQDSVCGLGILFTINQQPISVLNMENLVSYAEKGEGPLTHSNADALAFLRTKFANQSDDRPDVEL